MRKISSFIFSLLFLLTCSGTIVYANPSTECEHSLYSRVTQDLTCEEDGIVVYRCRYCDFEETVTTPTSGHSFGEWYYESEWDKPDCNYSGTMIQDCLNENCWQSNRKTIPALGHLYKKTVHKAKPNYDGYTEKICSRCDDWDDYTEIAAPSKIKLSTTTYVYNGKVKKPVVTVYDNEGKIIGPSHYTVTYQTGRKLVGKYKVTVTFKSSSSKYKGTLTTSFKINPKPTYITSLTTGTRSFKVKWKYTSSQVSGYYIRYSEYSDMDLADYKIIKSSKTLNSQITKLYDNEKYYVQVRAYKVVNGIKYYSAWSSIKTIKTKKNTNTGYTGSIYITRTGECYHTHACGRGTYYKSTLAAAKAMGLRACQKCF